MSCLSCSTTWTCWVQAFTTLYMLESSCIQVGNLLASYIDASISGRICDNDWRRAIEGPGAVLHDSFLPV